MSNTKTIRCSCYHEMLHLSWDEELNILDMSIWAPYSTDTKMSWKQRLRYCWRILTHGKPYGDQLVLEKDHIDELAEYLNELRKSLS